jgi:hypothetical protein
MVCLFPFYQFPDLWRDLILMSVVAFCESGVEFAELMSPSIRPMSRNCREERFLSDLVISTRLRNSFATTTQTSSK